MQAYARNFKVPAGSFQPRIADRMPGLLGCRRHHALRDAFGWNRYRALALCLSMIFSENRFPLFRIML